MSERKHTPIQLKLPLDGTLEIPLTKGQIAIVDLIDADLAECKWYASFNREYANGGKFIAGRNIPLGIGKQQMQTMHRFIATRIAGRPLARSEQVDHINGNPLDNRRDNLRLATNGQNRMNTGKNRNSKSKYKGVTWNKKTNKWEAQIQADGQKQHLGSFTTEEEAHIAYREAATVLHGKFARFE